MLRSRGDQAEELEPLNPRHPDSLAASPSRTPTPSPASKRPRPSPVHSVGGGANGGSPHGAAAVLPEYLEGLHLEADGAQPRPLQLWQLLLAGGLLLTVALVAVDYEMEVCVLACVNRCGMRCCVWCTLSGCPCVLRRQLRSGGLHFLRASEC